MIKVLLFIKWWFMHTKSFWSCFFLFLLCLFISIALLKFGIIAIVFLCLSICLGSIIILPIYLYLKIKAWWNENKRNFEETIEKYTKNKQEIKQKNIKIRLQNGQISYAAIDENIGKISLCDIEKKIIGI